MVTAANVVLAAGIAWGVFAFGAVYPWGYWPLAVFAQAVGLAGMFVSRVFRTRFPGRVLSLAVVIFLVAVTVQLTPLPSRTLAALSPQTPQVLAQYYPGAGVSSSHPLSISPSDTARGLALTASFALLALGASRLFTLRGATGACTAVTIVGCLLAIAGIVQKALYNGRIYGFWKTIEGGNPYGPFPNRNHFAGWMLMAIPLSLGAVCAGVSRGMRGVQPALRDRVLWLTSPDASDIVLHAAAVALMALSLALSMSRSGISGAACALAATAILAWQQSSGPQRIALIGGIMTIALTVVAWAGIDPIFTRFSATDVHDLNGRFGPWGDALRIAAGYPLTGTGLNTYGIATLFHQQFNISVHYSAAHNDYLQLLAEGGALLAIPVVICIAALAATIRRRFREETSRTTFWIRAGATIGLLSIGMQECVDFSLQIPANAFLFAVLCAIAIHRTPERRRA